jgi:hypothetical protein
MKITDLRCAIIGRNPVVRIVADEGLICYTEAESFEPYRKPHGLFYRVAKNGLIDVWDRPGMGVEFDVDLARRI